MFASLREGLLSLPAGEFFYRLTFHLVPAFLFLYCFSGVLLPFMISIVIAYVIVSFNSQLVSLGVSKRFSMPIVSMIIISICLGSTLYLAPLVWKQSISFALDIPQLYTSAKQWIIATVSDYLGGDSAAILTGFFDNLSRGLGTAINVIANNTFGSLISVASMSLYLVIIPVLVFFFVRDREQILTFLTRLFKNKSSLTAIGSLWVQVDAQLRSYIQGKLIEIVVVGIFAMLLFTFVNLKYGLLLATAVGLSVLIPFVGAFVVTFPVMAVAFSQFGLTQEFAFVACGYLILQVLDGNVLVPVIFSEKMKIHPVAIILAVLLFGSIGGIAGVFFAIPLLAVLKIYIDMKFPV